MKHIVLIVMAIVAVNCMKKEETNLHGGRAHTPPSNLEEKLSSAALSIIDPMVVYDPSYISIIP
jgi:hypothetical protein